MKSLLENAALSEECIASTMEVLRTGNLYRYTCDGPEGSQVSMFEKEFAHWVGTRFAIGVNSCGGAMYIVLRAHGIGAGDDVLMSAFTYTAVPSAIVNSGAQPILVECTDSLGMSADDLERKLAASGPRAKAVIVSHMRGHMCNMPEVAEACRKRGVILIEDCAHALGAWCDGRHAGTFGTAGCFSSQSHKLLNSGEGGVLVTDDELLASRAILLAGSQEGFWRKHFIGDAHLPELQNLVPNLSMRMSNLAAAVLRPQLRALASRRSKFEANFRCFCAGVKDAEYIEVVEELPNVSRMHDTVQFRLRGAEPVGRFVERLRREGIVAQHFAYEGNPRYYRSWKYIRGIQDVELPQTEKALLRLVDLRLPHWLNEADVGEIARAIVSLSRQPAS